MNMAISANNSKHIIFYGLIILATAGAFPVRPGSCRSGVAVGGSHSKFSDGAITSGKFEMLIDDKPLHEQSDLELVVGVPYTWEFRGMEGNSFRGFLSLFTHDDGADLSDALTLDSQSLNLARIYDSTSIPSCPRRSVAAGHRSRTFKQSIKGEVIFDEEGKVNVEITTVLINTLLSDEWYYSKYSFNVVSNDVVVTESPTPLPSKIPTKSPSKTPTSNPTVLITESPTDAPTSNPTDQPTKTPTEAPTKTPTVEPTQIESIQPISNFTDELSVLQPGELNTTESNATSSFNMSLAPSTIPTAIPTYTPSSVTTDNPTITQTAAPTKAPTDDTTGSTSLSGFSIFFGN